MKYRDLLDKINNMPLDRLDDNVTVNVRSQNEFFAVIRAEIATDKQDVLDPGHLFLII